MELIISHSFFIFLIMIFVIYKILTKKKESFKKFDKNFYFINFIFSGVVGVYFYFIFGLFHVALIVTIVLSGLTWYEKSRKKNR